MARETIGHVSCPCCQEDAHVREAKGGKVYIVCDSPVCGFQGFARSTDADRLLRGKMKPLAYAAALPVPEPKTTQKPEAKKGTLRELLNIDL
jgi:hypothetical protein